MKKTNIFKAKIVAMLLLSFSASFAQKMVEMSKEVLKDKVMGGWAGQTIGVTFGGPVEFKFNGTMINDYQKLNWNKELLIKTMVNSPGLYDDLYMDLTFVEVFEKEGLDAPVQSHARAYANAGYMLWHANQAARYNIMNGIMPPASGHWHNNPHADCIDYQIEADFAGLMSPGMPNTASAISDKIGHIMNYGDGWYGGVYIGAMYALGLVSSDVNYVVNEALKTIPRESQYYKCISDVIKWHRMYPDNWKKTWFELQQKWTNDVGCPDGVFAPFNIDATINSAYVVLGLLYGNGDFTQTMEITTRCGQDADCNPSSSGGILGAILGYKAIPAYWKQGLAEIENMHFKYTSTSLNKVYEIGTKHAIQNILKNGGKENGTSIIIKTQQAMPVKLEQSFEGHYPLDKTWIGKSLKDEVILEFAGNGFVVKGESKPIEGSSWDSKSEKFAEVEVYVDNLLTETVKLPINFTTRRHEICWKYNLTDSTHQVRLKLIHPDPSINCYLSEILWYSSKPQKQMTIGTYGPKQKKIN